MQTVSLLDMVLSLSKAMDCISSAVTHHHARVGLVAGIMGRALGLEPTLQRDLILAGLLHDAGALSLKSRIDALQFETDGMEHAVLGYRLLRGQPRLERVALLVRDHHVPWSGIQHSAGGMDPASNILCLADRVDVLLRRDQPVTPQLSGVWNRLRASQEQLFHPHYVEAFLDCSRTAGFGERLETPLTEVRTLAREVCGNGNNGGGGLCGDNGDALDLAGQVQFSGLFSQIIDFRSRFTATHSRGVAATAARLAEFAGFTDHDIQVLHVAGNLHDLGKLAVPQELLEKVTPLLPAEFERIKHHALHSHDILGEVPGLEQVRLWAAQHHERLDGKGYPFGRHNSELCLGSRIVAVADVFTAITEKRPYRDGMDRQQAEGVLRRMAAEHALDGHVTSLLLDNYEVFNEIRSLVQQQADAGFRAFYRGE